MEAGDCVDGGEVEGGSPISVLQEEMTVAKDAAGEVDKCGANDMDSAATEAMALPFELEAKNGDTTLISKAMAEEEERLFEERMKKEEQNDISKDQNLRDEEIQFARLDDLLTQTKLYSEFLLDKMDDITHNQFDSQTEENGASKSRKGGRSRKRKAETQLDHKRVKAAVTAMLTKPHDGTTPEDAKLTDEERSRKEQDRLVPLMTGGELKPYQVKGVKWLISLWQNGLNGILADQMGLGKTIQTIGFLAHLKGMGLHGPYLVVAPLSTLSNWVNEISRFVPSMKGILYHGTKQERKAIREEFMPKDIGPMFPIVVTSYEVVLNDAKILSRYKWKYVVVDEGHRLKNKNCLLLRELRRLPIENKLLLTGTPLQNNLAELWSLLNFLLPDIFSSYNEFESWFDFSGKYNDQSDHDDAEKRRLQVVSKLHAILRPFLLRRVKDDVEKMLPQKKEIILYANMTEYQKKIQNHLINKTMDQYIDDKGGFVIFRAGVKRKLNNLIMQLRKNCNHPDLLDSIYDGTDVYPPIEQLVEQCGKFRLLERLLDLLLSRNHKILLFSQFTSVLDIIEYYLGEKGILLCRIDGGVKLNERIKQIEEFNNIESNLKVFLLSTRAGGLGINLTAADTCVIYDSDWNPQMDLQAMDRCHRIGQTRPVHVYRLASSHSVEGRILKRAYDKLKLEHVVIGKGNFEQERASVNSLEESELLALLREEEDGEDKFVQTDISDENLLKVMDRSDMGGAGTGGEGTGKTLPLKGPGWEVVLPVKSTGVLPFVGS